MEAQVAYKYAEDSGYAILQVMVKPYESANTFHDPRKARFNSKLSAIRTVMTENIFGRWKKRFPILTNLITHLELSQELLLQL